jgi:hypothetical protein
MATEPKMKVVETTSTAISPTPNQDDAATAAALMDGFEREAMSDFVFHGRPIEIHLEKGFVRRMTGDATDAIDPQRPHIVDLRSCEEMWECWKPGLDGKNKKIATIGPIRVIDGIKLPPLDTLPDRDRERWEFSKDGKRRLDPWRKRFLLNVKDTVSNELLSWRYGFEAYDTVAAVKAAYARGFEQHPGQMPVVLFGVQRIYSYDGTPRTNAALILTGDWLPFGEGQAPPPAPVTSGTAKTVPIPTISKGPPKVFGEDEIPF